MKWTRWLAVAIVAGACGPCACCATLGPSPDLEVSDVVGTWRYDEESFVTFREDGTYTAQNLYVCELPTDGSPGTGEGEWELGPAHTLTAIQNVELDFAGEGSKFSMIKVWNIEDEISYYIGDPDSVHLCRFKKS